jgi:hypothetical protein
MMRIGKTDILRGDTDNGDGRRSNGDRHPGGVHPMSVPDKNIEIPDFSLIVLIGSTGS